MWLENIKSIFTRCLYNSYDKTFDYEKIILDFCFIENPNCLNLKIFKVLFWFFFFSFYKKTRTHNYAPKWRISVTKKKNMISIIFFFRLSTSFYSSERLFQIINYYIWYIYIFDTFVQQHTLYSVKIKISCVQLKRVCFISYRYTCTIVYIAFLDIYTNTDREI